MLNIKDRKYFAKLLISVGVPVTITFVSYAVFKKTYIVEIGASVLLGSTLYLTLDDYLTGPHITANDRYASQQIEEELAEMFPKEESKGRTK